MPGQKSSGENAAMRVIAHRLADFGLLPVSVDEALAPTGQQHRRWMPHGTSHHLGLDVHDCAQAKRELYIDGIIEEGMVFTIEPGLYFKEDDLAVPEEYRGIGVRLELRFHLEGKDPKLRRAAQGQLSSVQGLPVESPWGGEVYRRTLLSLTFTEH